MAISANHLRALGRISVEFGSAEWLLGHIISVLIGDDLEVGEIVTSHATFRERTDLFYSLFKHKYGQRKCPELKTILTDGQRLVEERNRYIHSFWSDDGRLDSVTRSKVSARIPKGLHEEKAAVSSGKLNELADNFEKWSQRLIDFIGEVI